MHHESDQLRHEAPDHDPDAGRGLDQRRRPCVLPDASGHLPRAERPEDLRFPRLHWHEPRPDGGLHRQRARAVFPVRGRHRGYRYTEHPAGGLVRAVVLPGHRHGAGDGPGRGDVGPGDVVDAQGDPAANDHADGLRQRPGGLSGVRERSHVAGEDGRPGAERDPAAGAEVRPRHRRDLAVRAQHAVHRHQCRPAQAPGLQPDSAAGDRGPRGRKRRHSRREHLHQRLDADGGQQCDGG